MATIGHFEKIRALCGSVRLLVTGGVRTGTASQVLIFDHVAGKLRHTLDLPTHVLGLALGGDGDRVICAGADGRLRVFDAGSGKELHQFAAHTGAAVAVVHAGDDAVYSAGADGAVRRWSLSGKRLGEWTVSPQALRALAVDPTGAYVAAGGDSGVVHVVTPMTPGPQRDMPGHEGPVNALAFTPRDGRLVSAGEDSSLRLWYLVGAIECETRATDVSDGGAVLALLFPPTPPEQPGQDEPTDRIFAAGSDGKLRVFRLEDRRKPRTLDGGSRPLYGLCYLPPTPTEAKTSHGGVACGGDNRTIYWTTLDKEGAPADMSAAYEHGFAAQQAAVGSQKPAREAAYKVLAALDEPEALELLLRQLAAEKEPELRAQIARDLGLRRRRPARTALRQALDDGQQGVRRAALAALRAIDEPGALSPLRAALRGRYSDVRQEALTALSALGETSPLVPGLIIGMLGDAEASVRLAALDALSVVYTDRGAGSAEPLRVAFERGPADIRAEVLVRAAFAGLLPSPELLPLLGKALDDADAEVRRIAFALAVLLRRPLADLLEGRDEDYARTTREIARRGALLSRAGDAGPKKAKAEAEQQKEPGDAEITSARAKLLSVLGRHEQEAVARDPAAAKAVLARIGGAAGTAQAALTEDDLGPLLTAMACRTPHTALRGARGLALLGDTRALGALLQLTREADPGLRREAAGALKALHDTRARKRLVWMLDDGDAGVRAAALESYAELCEATDGKAAAPLQVADAALHSSHEDIRVRGLDRLVKLGAAGQRGGQVETLLGNALEDEAAKVRAEALRTLWSWHEQDPQTVIDRALLCRFPDLRLRAVEELVRLGKEPGASDREARYQERSPAVIDRLKRTIADRDADVAQAAYDAVVKLRGKEDAEAHLLAVASTHKGLREAAARGAKDAGDADSVRAALVRLLDDEEPGVRTAALETLDRRLPKDTAPHYAALQGPHLDLRVRAAELLAQRHDERLIDPMRAILADKELWKRFPADWVKQLRLRAASALATLGSPRTVKYLATELIKDEHADVREQASRGLATAARAGDEGYLLDLLGHGDIWVRSWAADGLSRLGDARAVPVLTGTLRHDHLPIRFSAIISFAALGPEGYGGMLQGLEDPSRDVQEIIFAIILSRDLQAFRRGQAPDLLASALSSQRAEVRFAAARALELRTDQDSFLEHIIEVLTPLKPEKAQDMKDWPGEEVRGRALLGLADALAADSPAERYAAAQVLRLRKLPLDYFREAQRIARPRSLSGAPLVPDTAQTGFGPSEAGPKKGWLRRLFHGDGQKAESPEAGAARGGAALKRAGEAGVPAAERAHLLRLAFGAYVGLLRQATAAAGEDERVRRDAVDRIVELGLGETIGLSAALPAVVRALDDPHYLVRKAAFAGLKRLYPAGSEEPWRLALRSSAADVARAALDEVAAQAKAQPGAADGPAPELRASPIAAALSSPLQEVRRYAFELLERLAPQGSLEPLLLALQSEYSDLRIGVIERLSTQRDGRVTAALQRAMESDHDDLRLRAAELLADRKDDRAADVLGALLRSEEGGVAARAQQALQALGTAAAVRALAARLERDEDEAGAQVAARVGVAETLGQTGNAAAVGPLSACLEDESAELRQAAFAAGLDLAARAGAARAPKGPAVPLPFVEEDPRLRRDEALLLPLLQAAARAKDPELRRLAAEELGAPGSFAAAAAGGGAVAVNELLVGLFTDRDPEVRKAAVRGYSLRVRDERSAAPVEPLLGVLRAGARDLLLPAAEGAAERHEVAALRPLLLLSRAGEDTEREPAVLALGTLGDGRALAELETLAAGGTKDAPAEEPMRAAAMEALGRIAGRLADKEAQRRVIDKVEEAGASAPELKVRLAAVRGLRYIGQALGSERSRSRLEGLLLDGESDDEVQTEAATQLGLLCDPQAEQALRRALDDWTDDVRIAARRALDKIFKDERTRVEFLAVDSRNEDISEPAVAFLAQEGDPALLLPRLGTLRDEGLRRRLRYGLLRREHLAVDGLLALLSQKDAAAREAAAWLLGARAGRGPVAPEMLAALGKAEQHSGERWAQLPGDEKEPEERAWVRLLWAATNLTAPSAKPAGKGGAKAAPGSLLSRARELLAMPAGGGRPPAAVLLQALRALCKLGGAGDAELLKAALSDGDPGVREAAAATLGVLAPEQSFGLAVAVRPFDAVSFAPAARTPPAAALSTSEGRRLALPALIGGHDVAALVEVLHQGRDQAARLDAAAALGRIGGDQAVAALRQAAFDREARSAAVTDREARSAAVTDRAQRSAAPSIDKKGADEALRKAAYRALRRAQRLQQQKKKHEAHA